MIYFLPHPVYWLKIYRFLNHDRVDTSAIPWHLLWYHKKLKVEVQTKNLKYLWYQTDLVPSTVKRFPGPMHRLLHEKRWTSTPRFTTHPPVIYRNACYTGCVTLFDGQITSHAIFRDESKPNLGRWYENFSHVIVFAKCYITLHWTVSIRLGVVASSRPAAVLT